MIAKLAPYRKTIVALLGAAVAIGTYHLGADSWIVQDAVVLLTALGVYGVANA